VSERPQRFGRPIRDHHRSSARVLTATLITLTTGSTVVVFGDAITLSLITTSVMFNAPEPVGLNHHCKCCAAMRPLTVHARGQRLVRFSQTDAGACHGAFGPDVLADVIPAPFHVKGSCPAALKGKACAPQPTDG
jgi:hypothetical protein